MDIQGAEGLTSIARATRTRSRSASSSWAARRTSRRTDFAARSHAEYVEGDSLVSMIREDLVAERIAIDSYREIIQYLGDQDSTTRRMLEDILAVEEEHADELADLLVTLPGAAIESGGARPPIEEDCRPHRSALKSGRPPLPDASSR